MKLNRNITKQVDETRYLVTENTRRYRAICRIIYDKYEKMKYWLYKEEILEELKENDIFYDYTEEMIKNDLNTLVSWKNLLAVADTTKVNTVDEFVNREFRYQLSEVGIEVERFLISLEDRKIENSASLEEALVENFKNLLKDYKGIIENDEKSVYNWWTQLNGAFKELNRNYQDYISKFYSPKNDELMKTTEFLMFKESFIKYLRQFVKNIQTNSYEIREILIGIGIGEIETIINKVYGYEKSIETIGHSIDYEKQVELNKARINSIKEWFIETKGREPLIEQLIGNTNEVIRKITRYALQIADRKNNNSNRKEEYLNLARIFNNIENIEDAHKLCAGIFGTFNIIKIHKVNERETDSINSSVYQEKATEYPITPRTRDYKEKIIKNPIKDKKAKREEKLKVLLERRTRESDRIRRLLKDNVIDLENLNVIEREDRILILRLITKGNISKELWKKSDFGMAYKVTISDKKNSILLKCEDGDLYMPNYKIIFREE